MRRVAEEKYRMNTYWLIEQTKRNLSQFETAMETYYPESRRYLRDAASFYARISEECNYVQAVDLIDWRRYFKPGAKVLDLGGGSGWLSGYLSKYDGVETIYLLDSSRYFLHDMLPPTVQLAGGRPEKIVPIEGLFTPLLFEDSFLDVVVASSAVHHGDNLESLLREVRRVLKKDGQLFILNETPHSQARYLLAISRAFLRMLRDTALCRFQPVSPSVSSSGYLYDPYLGDKTFPIWYWERAIARAGFSLAEIVDTHLPTVKGKPGRSLTHFLCRAV
jgi:ubiquinone/menaquinone biosynthesis C-methylase UbiE